LGPLNRLPVGGLTTTNLFAPWSGNVLTDVHQTLLATLVFTRWFNLVEGERQYAIAGLIQVQ